MIIRPELEQYQKTLNPARYEPFQVTLYLQTQPVLYDPLRLDAILANAVRIDCGLKLAESAEPYFLPTPLRCAWAHPDLNLPLWKCTDFKPCEKDVVTSAFWHKRTIRPEMVKRPKSGKAVNIISTNGREKEYRIPLPLHSAMQWRCVACGDIDEVARLLEYVGAIGKKRTQGYGIVSRWEIEKIRDFSFFRNGATQRPIPIFAIENLTGGQWRLGSVKLSGLGPSYCRFKHGERNDEDINGSVQLSGWTPPYWLQTIMLPCLIN